MKKYIEKTGRTTDDAIAAALAELHLEREDVEVEVLQAPKTGFLGFGAAPARVRVGYEVPEEPAPAPAPVKAEEPVKPERPQQPEAPAAVSRFTALRPGLRSSGLRSCGRIHDLRRGTGLRPGLRNPYGTRGCFFPGLPPISQGLAADAVARR